MTGAIHWFWPVTASVHDARQEAPCHSGAVQRPGQAPSSRAASRCGHSSLNWTYPLSSIAEGAGSSLPPQSSGRSVRQLPGASDDGDRLS